MHRVGRAGLVFRIRAGHAYRDPVQLFNRCLMPVYQTSYRWTGNRMDAEDVTTWVFINEFRPLDLPRSLPAVDDPLIEATVHAIGKPWTKRSGISSLRGSALPAAEAAAPLPSNPSLS